VISVQHSQILLHVKSNIPGVKAKCPSNPLRNR
jgi:pyruvate/2-oxoglutarate/acetoin dehydrogenase E1 component